MTLPKLALRPDSSGYSVKDGEDVDYIAVDGGPGRYNRDMWGSTSMVNVSWTLVPIQHQYLRAFYNTTTQKGSLPFLCDLILDDPEPVELICRIVPGTMNLGSQQGWAYTSSCTFEVEPAQADEDLDASLVELYGLYGDDMNAVLNALEQLVNLDLPGVA